MKRSILISGLILGLGLSGPALADETGERGYKDRGDRSGHMQRWTRQLDLTESQQEQLKATRQSYGPELRSLHGEIREQREALRASSRDGFNEEAARSSADRLGELMAERAFLQSRMRADVGEILTDEQKAKIAERREARAERGNKGWRGHGRHRHNG
ncbi:Spy/CpxP family protein refolding chaperone [Methylonatrum kenyense]|uniref:Spy/CpxP family protein refolding chaperone n=1 Tax=Methylonatrum kenyense TaxID=455253 RepID=UPI0020C11999|nr:Spy/CpxP family protein refolding chaperone [Methylonatrum kenyense]MCK8517147.1 Spy/CpxP family protein refolding chaperone [Methylonatrum kenyense]